jgi:mRNA interferase MazF
LDEPGGAEPGYTHPQVVIQENILNRSRLKTVVVCALTSNLKRANIPGNILLDAGEANLPRQSVVVVSQVSTVDKTQLGQYIGTLDPQRIEQILAGMRFVQSLTEHHETGEEK